MDPKADPSAPICKYREVEFVVRELPEYDPWDGNCRNISIRKWSDEIATVHLLLCLIMLVKHSAPFQFSTQAHYMPPKGYTNLRDE